MKSVRPGAAHAWLRSNILGLVAIFIALSGSAIATQVARQDGATTAKVKRGKRGPVGPVGPAGPTGPQGLIGPSTGAAGGDLTGNYPDPVIAPLAVDTAELDDGAVTDAKLAPPAGFTIVNLFPIGPSCTGGFNIWGTYDPGRNDVSYHRDRNGFVHLRGGAIKCGSPTTDIFFLPAGFRPARQEVQVAVYSTGVNRIEINTSGSVVPDPAMPNLGTVSLDGITFRCAPSGMNGCP